MRRLPGLVASALFLVSVAVGGVIVSNTGRATATPIARNLASPTAASAEKPAAQPTVILATPTGTQVPPAVSVAPPQSDAPSPTPTSAANIPVGLPRGVRPGRLVFDDEFNGSGLDFSKWAYARDDDGLGGVQHWDPGACRVTDGALRIVAQGAASYTSCAIWTQGEEAIGPYGYWEMRARIPATPGTWPALWCVPYDRLTDPTLGAWEMDIMEAISHVIPNANIVSWNLHARNAAGHSDDFQRFGDPNSLGTGLYAPAWHTYGMEWRPDHIAWYVDGVQQFRVIAGETVDGMTVKIPSMRQVLILQMAVGGAEAVDETRLPAVMDVDYIRVYA